MSEATQPADAGPLSVDQAVASLLPPVQAEQPEDHGEVEPPEGAPEPDVQDETPEAEPVAEEPAEEAENPSEDGETEGEAEAVAPAEPPKYWAKDAKEAFSKLPPELQAVVLAQEGPREEAAAKAKQEAAEIRQRADQEIQVVSQVVEKLNQFLPDALAKFKSKWDDVDWAAYAEQDPQAAMRDRFIMEQEQANLAQIAKARQEAEVVEHQAFLRAEAEKLSGTPLEAPEARHEVGKYLFDAGIPPQAIAKVSAAELTIAHKAMLWDRAQAQLKAKPPAPKPAAPVRPMARPQASSAQSPSTRSAATIANRFAQTRSVDDAVALLLAKKG